MALFAELVLLLVFVGIFTLDTIFNIVGGCSISLALTQGILVPCYAYVIMRVHNLVQGKNTMTQLVQFNKSIRYIKTNGKVLANHVQLALADLANHTIETGDWSKINVLDQAVANSSGLRVESFRAYIKDLFVGLKFDDKLKVWLRKSKNKSITIDDEVFAINWTEYTKETTPTFNYDNRVLIEKLIENELKAKDKAEQNNATFKGDQKEYYKRLDILRGLSNIAA